MVRGVYVWMDFGVHTGFLFFFFFFLLGFVVFLNLSRVLTMCSSTGRFIRPRYRNDIRFSHRNKKLVIIKFHHEKDI